MTERISLHGLKVATPLYNLLEEHVIPQLPVSSDDFWQGATDIIKELSPINKTLLEKRDSLQQSIDEWHSKHKYTQETFPAYKSFLEEIGYIEPSVTTFTINTENVDAELAKMAGPQLVVPIMNARFALNAVNARWGSLYDALYGSDVIAEDNGAEKTGQYNPIRGQQVIKYAKQFLDDSFPLVGASHNQVIRYGIENHQLVIETQDGAQRFKDADAFLGYKIDGENLSILLTHNNLKIELVVNPNSAIGQTDTSGLADINVESALTTIMDCEDSVAAVDADDKVLAYSNWLGLVQGTLTETVTKGGKSFTRSMNADKAYTDKTGQHFTTKGRSVMFVRNVGHLMTNNVITDEQGQPVPEGIVDAIVTSAISALDVLNKNTLSNSEHGSIYIVKPKMHGSEEVAFANQLFSAVERMLTLPENTIKMGIMDEERRTSINLKNCIHAAKDRVVFINTGFLDRTGDEIHTSMLAGPMTRKNEIKQTPWIGAYEQNNVDIGLACGLSGKAQIGKGMWPVPDNMQDMMSTKIAHVESGANTAWVPSPTAATLHALHYHQIDVFALQQTLLEREAASLDDILTIPLAVDTNWTKEEISQELDNNCQGILGYVVRWIDQGIGCSKVPDINDVGLMEDRATLRISSQHIANWLAHSICSAEQVIASLQKMAAIVDEQNKQDPLYQSMAPKFENSIAYKAAYDLIFKGKEQPSGYTEPLLHHYREEKKALG
ncbi:malate synthase G [Thalassotalea euphylliae]|uniref:malate synthase G n=1 Tax=Thalassotalea euphylliae TaxID=1655234 RepID=UPI00362E11BA